MGPRMLNPALVEMFNVVLCYTVWTSVTLTCWHFRPRDHVTIKDPASTTQDVKPSTSRATTSLRSPSTAHSSVRRQAHDHHSSIPIPRSCVKRPAANVTEMVHVRSYVVTRRDGWSPDNAGRGIDKYRIRILWSSTSGWLTIQYNTIQYNIKLVTRHI